MTAPSRALPHGDEGVDIRYVSPRPLGHLRLLAGMVLANRPWRLVGSMSAAFAAAAYSLITPSIWSLADSLSPLRLFAAGALAVRVIVASLIVDHHTWERPAHLWARD